MFEPVKITNLTIELVKNGRLLLKDFSFTLNAGDKAVIIGEEGNGKSTLLKLIASPAPAALPYAAHSGEIYRGGNRIGYLPQELEPENAVLTAAEYADFDNLLCDCGYSEGYALAENLGIPPELPYSAQPMSSLSGGEKVKLRLLKILAASPDLLLLDEPTNDIDIHTIRWLENFIAACRLPILYISHDETLIERTANIIIHIEQLVHKRETRHTVSRTGYTEYVRARRESLAHTEQVAKKQRQEYREQQERWREIYEKVDTQQRNISRQNPSGGRLLKKKMKTVKSLERRFEREKDDFEEIPIVEEAIFMKFSDYRELPPGKEILNLKLDRLEIENRLLAENLRLCVRGGEHIAITGRNGCGKTLLMKRIAEALQSRPDLNARYMPQNYDDMLNPNETPVDFLAPTQTREETTLARTHLGSMRFTADEMTGRISALSGGQKAKLLLLKMTVDGSNVLILDEPTRNLSPLSNPVVRSVLSEYSGTIISVSHDRKFLSQVCDKVYEFTQSGLTPIEIATSP